MVKGKKTFAIILLVVLFAGMIFPCPGAAVDRGEEIDVIIGFQEMSAMGLVENLGGTIGRELGMVRAAAVRIPARALEALSRHPLIRYIEPDAPVYLLETALSTQQIPWGVQQIFSGDEYPFASWAYSSNPQIGVAVIDTGIDGHHQDLMVVDGINTIDHHPWSHDVNGHGTHVAGTIAALDNHLGVVGVHPSVHLYSVKVLNDQGAGTVSSLVAGIEWAVNQNIPVLNMSLGSSSHSQTLQNACDAAYAAGHLLVAAAGNSGAAAAGSSTVVFPARYDSVIAVAASTSMDARASFSSTGPQVELMAPGVGIFSTLPENRYGTGNGTSMAAPHAAGAAALIWSINSDLTHNEVRLTLQETAEDLGLPAEHQGFGLVQADRAAAAVAPAGEHDDEEGEEEGDEGQEDGEKVRRIAGANRHETAVEISAAGWPQGSETVLLARSDDFADALAAVPLAHRLDAPILLTPPHMLHETTAVEIARLAPHEVIILGSFGAISPDVEDALRGMGLDVRRLAGANRYETAVMIAEEMTAGEALPDTAFITVGTDFADTLAVSSYAARMGFPIFMTRTLDLPAATAQALVDMGIKKTYVIGGASVISDNVFSTLPGPVRIAGANRYATAAALAEEFLPAEQKSVYLATGLDFPDAITGAVLAAKTGSGILLVQGSREEPNQVVKDFISARHLTSVTLFGGEGAISAPMESWLRNNLPEE